MERRAFGSTGIAVSALGFGAGHVGDPRQGEDAVGTILNRAVDLGVNLVDTARGYGLSEERIGRHLSWRRHEVVISSKGGYGVDGVPDWTGQTITRGVDAALARLNTDYLDIYHLHSCPKAVLEHSDVIPALERAVQDGKVRVAAYSGENDALAWAVGSRRFGSIELSVNICDQGALEGAVPDAAARGLGVIAKRPLANAPWRFPTQPVGAYAEVYWLRLREMGLSPGDLDWDEFALRFSAFQPGVSSAIVGTSSVANLHRNVELMARGPLPDDVIAAVRAAYFAHGSGWDGQV